MERQRVGKPKTFPFYQSKFYIVGHCHRSFRPLCQINFLINQFWDWSICRKENPENIHANCALSFFLKLNNSGIVVSNRSNITFSVKTS